MKRFVLTLLVALPPTLSAGDPNAVDAIAWPPTDNPPVFLFKNAFEPILAHRLGDEQPIFNYELQAQGFARPRSSGALDLAHGAYLVPDQGAYLADWITTNQSLALELFIRPERLEANGDILRLGNGAAPALVIGQRNGEVFLRLKHRTVTELTSGLETTAGSHLFIQYGDGGLALFLDGHLVASAAGLSSPLVGLQQAELWLGSGSADEPGWRGQVEGLAIYTNLIDPKTTSSHSEAYHQWVNLRQTVKRIRLKAQLTARSQIAKLAEIAPYTESLSVFEYKVLQVLEGAYFADKIRVAHRVILDARMLPVGERVPQTIVTMEVESFDDNRQLRNIHLSDTLPIDFDLDLFFDTGAPY